MNKTPEKKCILCGGDYAVLRTTEPCQACRKEYLTDGVLLLEYKTVEREGKPKDIATGKYMVILDEVFDMIFGLKIPELKVVLVREGTIEAVVKGIAAAEKKGTK